MRPKFFAELHQLFRLRKLSFAESFGESFPDSIIVHWPDVGPAEIEKQEHLNRPTTDAADLDQALDNFVVTHCGKGASRRHRAVECFCGEIFDRGDLAA